MGALTLKQKIQEAMKTAMREKEKGKLAAIRLILAEICRVEVDERVEIDDTRVLALLDKMIKQRRDSIQQYSVAERQDLVENEEFELVLIQTFMPKPLREEEVRTLIAQAVQETEAASVRDMGKVMAWLKPKVQGRVDMGVMGAQIKSLLVQK